MKLFHLAQQRLGPGSVILPGNYGRMLRRYGWAHRDAFREVALEQVRASCFPDRPSRLTCAFAFPSANLARRFQSENAAFGHHVLHRVRPLSEPAPEGAAAGVTAQDVPVHVAGEFVTDWHWINPAPHDAFGIDWAARYWRGIVWNDAVERSGVCGEVLVPGPLVVEECLDDV